MTDLSKKDKKFNRLISVALALAIIVSIGVYAYVTFVKKSTSSGNENPPIVPQTTVLTVTLGSQSYNYTMDQLMAYPGATGQGTFINNAGKITGPKNYTGVSMILLLDTLPSLPEDYMLNAVAQDGYSLNYTLDEVHGHIMIKNETGGDIGVGNLTMIIAYKENGVLMNETTGGPLRIVFIDDIGSITHASQWLRLLERIEIQEAV